MRKLLIVICLFFSCQTAFAFTGAPKDDENCQGAWLFEEGSGTTVADSSQNSNTGNFKGAGEPAWAAMSGTNAPAYADYMADFDGSDDYIDCGNDSSLMDTTSFTVVAWILLDGTDASNDDVIVGKTNSNFSQTGWFFVQHVNSTKIDFGFWNGAAYKVANGVTSIGTTNWTHVECVFDDDNDWNQVYINANATADATATSVGNPVSNSDNLIIGSQLVSSGKSINAKMVEVAYFDRLLSSTERSDIMDNGLAGGAVWPQYNMLGNCQIANAQMGG